MKFAGFLLCIAMAASAQTTPSTFEELSQAAQQAYDANHDDEAARLFAEAVKLRPDWAQGWWAIGMITVVLLIVGLGSYWLNDMHMYHYGLFGSQ